MLAPGGLGAFLFGEWQLLRRYDDRRLGLAGRLRGTARFAPSPEGLDYEERGLMRFGDYRGVATRRYRFELSDGAKALVRFEDGRLFHALDLGTGQADVAHDCAPDRYIGRYSLLSPDRWTLRWIVEGPRKSYRMTSLYIRRRESRR